ncbi:MAG: PorV/PorQ family protein [Candidatus Cloacimonetes bacterium]|jgi:hypothetical protein|nr:PorV/PorQ family protein [Candidatus Cloacimonadota bacterium]MBT6993713.1 PorV/PorQ family protein [Candidatus Cloacimonadota bacterium]MBT7469382.1 PorV/PorQ family protein [Candidatus Cloacimonadota bacterium]
MRKHIAIILIVLIIPSIIFAEIFPKVGTAGMQFLKLGIDARASGMGEAYTAVTNDISSVYWNPAGLALQNQDQVFFSHLDYVANIKYEYFAASKVTDIGVFAFSGALLWMDWMDVYEEDNLLESTGEVFTCSDMAVGLTYSNAYTDKFSFGASVKYLQQYLDEYAVTGLAVDVGSLYNTGWKNTTIGMSLKNFGPNLKYELDNDGDGNLDEDPFDLLDNDGDGEIDEDREEVGFKIPLNFSLGIASELFRENNQVLLASLQLDNCVDRKETYNAGLEYSMGIFKLRSGYQFAYDAVSFSTGFGVKVPTSFAIVDFDYSYTHMGDLTESFFATPHRVSIKMKF